MTIKEGERKELPTLLRKAHTLVQISSCNTKYVYFWEPFVGDDCLTVGVIMKTLLFRHWKKKASGGSQYQVYNFYERSVALYILKYNIYLKS